MAEWRFARGWTDAELEQRLAEAPGLSRNFDASEEEMTPQHGWNRHFSESVIARSETGSPFPGDTFDRAWELVAGYAFSDPRIVAAHFDSSAPLLDRHMLLEVRVLGLHYLSAVVVGATHVHGSAIRSVRGFRYDTLEGHLERGSEWFLLTKEHRTGEIKFRIQAAWRAGDLPNAWSRVGFRMLVRRYQRVWHRLAHLRLRAMLGSTGLAPLPDAKRLVREDAGLVRAPLDAISRAPPYPELSSEKEENAMGKRHGNGMNEILTAAALGAVAGARSMLGPALVAAALSRQPRRRRRRRYAATRILASRGAMLLLPAMAAGEMAADKTTWIPHRTTPGPFVGRIASGALIGAALATPGRRAVAAAAGAGSAAVATVVLYRLRQLATSQLGLSNLFAGLCEDAAALGVGLLLVRAYRR